MAINNMNDGVGKKIVEALKMQNAAVADSNIVINEPASEEISSEAYFEETTTKFDESPIVADVSMFAEESNIEGVNNPAHSPERHAQIQSELQYSAMTSNIPSQSFVDNAFNKSLAQNLGSSYIPLQDDFEYPTNVAVLKDLIAKLPSGVSKQTGAMIIKQTMEALGISMGSVLQEARQVQETLRNNTRECQENIVEYKKQIGILESKSQNYQRQAVLMGDIINLFIQSK